MNGVTPAVSNDLFLGVCQLYQNGKYNSPSGKMFIKFIQRIYESLKSGKVVYFLYSYNI